MPRGISRFSKKERYKLSFKEGKWYHLDHIGGLPAHALQKMFRKPFIGEKLPDRSVVKDDDNSDCSDWELCIKSFELTLIYRFD